MIKMVRGKIIRLPDCFAGSPPAMIRLTLALPSIAVLSFDLDRATPIPACRERPTGLVASSVAFQTSIQRASAIDRRRQNPHSV